MKKVLLFATFYFTETITVSPSLSFRWLTLLLSQEFPLPDVQRLWDSILSDATRASFLVDLCAAMVVLARDSILANDFAENMKLLQVFLTAVVIYLPPNNFVNMTTKYRLKTNFFDGFSSD